MLTSPPNSTSPDATTVLSTHTDSMVIGVVIVLVLLTLVGLGFMLYRYQCHNKGAYRTTGEPAPGEDLDQAFTDTGPQEKKEYFI